MAFNLLGMVSNLPAKASNLLGMASNLLAMASYLPDRFSVHCWLYFKDFQRFSCPLPKWNTDTLPLPISPHLSPLLRKGVSYVGADVRPSSNTVLQHTASSVRGLTDVRVISIASVVGLQISCSLAEVFAGCCSCSIFSWFYP